MSSPPPMDQVRDDSTEFYAAYEGHSNILRTWLVAYGIGGPVLILSQDAVWQALAMAGTISRVAVLFLFGVALQVVLATLNKGAMWACYYVEKNPASAEEPLYKIGLWIADKFLIDFLVDIATIGLFVWATLIAFEGLVAAANGVA